jgi:hypothetical protein
VFLQSTWLRSRGASNHPMRYQFVVDLLEQLTLCKYKARPHWVSVHACATTKHCGTAGCCDVQV